MIYLGIDPGKSGAIAAVWDDGEAHVSYIKGDQTEHDIWNWLQGFDLDNARAVLEMVASRPTDGVRQAFTFGASYGFVRGMLTAAKVPYIEVTPKKWQAKMQCLTGGDKKISKARCQQLFPKANIINANADALLLAEYGRRHWQ
jgi:hypothetical protein